MGYYLWIQKLVLLIMQKGVVHSLLTRLCSVTWKILPCGEIGYARALLIPLGASKLWTSWAKLKLSRLRKHCSEHTEKASVGDEVPAVTCTTGYGFIFDTGKWVFKCIIRSFYSLQTSGSLSFVFLMQSITVNSVTIDSLHICWSIHWAHVSEYQS